MVSLIGDFLQKKNSLINKSKVVSINDVTLKRSIRYPAGRRNKSSFSVTSFTRWPFTSVTIEFLYLFTWTNLGEKIPIFCWENDLQVSPPPLKVQLRLFPLHNDRSWVESNSFFLEKKSFFFHFITWPKKNNWINNTLHRNLEVIL